MLLTTPAFLAACLSAATITFTTRGASVLLSLFPQDVRGVSALWADLALAPQSIGVAMASVLTGRRLQRVGHRTIMTFGIGLIAVVMLIDAAAVGLDRIALIVVAVTFSGMGLGMVSVASTALGMAGVAETRRGIAAGVLQSAVPLGTAIGIAALGAVASVSNRLAYLHSTETGHRPAGYAVALVVAGGFAVASMLMTRRLGRENNAAWSMDSST